MERFVKQMGYDPVLHERGRVTYGSGKKLEEYCYTEIDQCDVVVSIVGGRFGAESHENPYSISQMELKTAIDHGKAVYIFVDRSVYSEFATYQKNRNIPEVKYSFVDNVGVYRFLEEVEGLPRNNPIASFESAQDITDFLKEQWAGLFQRSLQEQSRLKEIGLVESMAATAQTLNQLVTFLTEERKSSDRAIRDILLTSHPAFQRLKTLLKVGYRVFFANRNELTAWLKARGYTAVDGPEWDAPEFEEWVNSQKQVQFLLKVSANLFDENGNLRIYTAQEWNKDLIHLEEKPLAPEPEEEETPF